MADRFFVEGVLNPGLTTISGPEAHHIGQVRRLTVGDQITLFNGDGREYVGTIHDLAKKMVTVEVQRIESPIREVSRTAHIAAALPKGDRGDFLIEKLTELGITDFTPLRTERSIVKFDDDKIQKIRRAVIEASKQCGRNRLMRVHDGASWEEWCRSITGSRFVAHVGHGEPFDLSTGDVTIAIGPEGGFSDDEVAVAASCGWQILSLGPRTLRVETAAIAAAVLTTLS